MVFSCKPPHSSTISIWVSKPKSSIKFLRSGIRLNRRNGTSVMKANGNTAHQVHVIRCPIFWLIKWVLSWLIRPSKQRRFALLSRARAREFRWTRPLFSLHHDNVARLPVREQPPFICTTRMQRIGTPCVRPYEHDDDFRVSDNQRVMLRV